MGYRKITPVLLFFCLLAAVACRQAEGGQVTGEPSFPPGHWEAISLLGDTLYARDLTSPAAAQRYDSLLQIAEANLRQDSTLDHYIWYGRRMAYLGKYGQAIEIFKEGLQKYPESPELYRHLGHRLISIREFEAAVRQFEKAATLAAGRDIEIEPDGLPNRLNIPLSNLQFNIYYHCGLGHYLMGDFATAAEWYEKCLEYSVNDDLLTATADWLYMAYRRMGADARAEQLLQRITPDMEIIENDAYFRRLLMYKGLLQPAELLNLEAEAQDAELLNLVTQGYGVGNWYLCNGDTARAMNVFKKITDTNYWSAFGYIAAEAELARYGND